MSNLREAAHQALQAIDRALPYAPYLAQFDAVADTANDLRAALSAPEQRHFCSHCGKRTPPASIHTCTPPEAA